MELSCISGISNISNIIIPYFYQMGYDPYKEFTCQMLILKINLSPIIK